MAYPAVSAMPDVPLKPVLQSMPADIRIRLAERNLTDTYRRQTTERKRQYIDWIESAKLSMVRNYRIGKMLRELEEGGAFPENATDTPSDERTS